MHFELGSNLWAFMQQLPGRCRNKYLVELYLPSGDIANYGVYFCGSQLQAVETAAAFHAHLGNEFGTAVFCVKGVCNEHRCYLGGESCGGVHESAGTVELKRAVQGKSRETEVDIVAELGVLDE